MKKLIVVTMMLVIGIVWCAGYQTGKFVDEGGYSYVQYEDGTRYELPSGGSDGD